MNDLIERAKKHAQQRRALAARVVGDEFGPAKSRILDEAAILEELITVVHEYDEHKKKCKQARSEAECYYAPHRKDADGHELAHRSDGFMYDDWHCPVQMSSTPVPCVPSYCPGCGRQIEKETATEGKHEPPHPIPE